MKGEGAHTGFPDRQSRSRPVIVIACMAASLAACLWAAVPASAATMTWDTPVFGGYEWVVPEGVTTAKFDLLGASGGLTGGSLGGLGGETVATIAVTPGETLRINVGGAGFNAPTSGVPSPVGAGTNGGGQSGFYCHPSVGDQSFCEGGGGGGASDVRQGGTALANRVLVAGGGGGGGGTSGTPEQTAGGDGGAGGGLVGARGSDGADTSPAAGGDPSFLGGCGSDGATQTAGGAVTNNDSACYGNYAVTGDSAAGAAGVGGIGGNSRGGADGGGGGGGYFGGGGGAGGAGGNDTGGPTGGGGGGGGGGSGYADPAATGASILAGANLGNGKVTVTYGGSVVTHTLTVTKTGTGSVTSSPAGIDCGVTCNHDFDHGTAVTLTPNPGPGFTFTSWGGGCSGTGACQVTMDQARSISATFVEEVATNPPPPPGPPDTSLVKSTVKGRKATFVFSGNGGIGSLSFECKLDGRPFTACASPTTLNGLKRGQHKFEVRAKDAGAQVDGTPAKKTFKVKRPKKKRHH